MPQPPAPDSVLFPTGEPSVHVDVMQGEEAFVSQASEEKSLEATQSKAQTIQSTTSQSSEKEAPSKRDGNLHFQSLYRSSSLISKVASSDWPTSGPMASWGMPRRLAYTLIRHQRFDMAMGVVIGLNMVLMTLETDERAQCYPEDCSEKSWIVWSNRVLLLVYTIEALLRFFVERGNYFKDRWNIADFLIVVFGYFDEIVNALAADALPSMQMLPMLRLFRIARMVRAVRLLRIFPELYVMVRGFFGAFRAMIWGLLLIILLLLFWSLVCVELVHPTNKEMISEAAKDPDYEANVYCEEAFMTVWNAFMLLFQTLVAGDSFGQCTLPIIEYSKLSFFIFSMALVTMSLGLMNLILAVIVDHATSAREGDREERIKEKRKQEEALLKKWKNMIQHIDLDRDGAISYDELLNAYDNCEVRDALNVMGMQREDLKMIFDLLDDDNSGSLDYNEFIDSFLKAQGQDMRIYLMMMKLRSDSTTKAVKALIKHFGVPVHDEDASPGRPCASSPAPRAGDQAKARRASAPAVLSSGTVPFVASFQTDFEKANMQLQEQFDALAKRLELNSTAIAQHTKMLEVTAHKEASQAPRSAEPIKRSLSSPLVPPLSPPDPARRMDAAADALKAQRLDEEDLRGEPPALLNPPTRSNGRRRTHHPALPPAAEAPGGSPELARRSAFANGQAGSGSWSPLRDPNSFRSVGQTEQQLRR